MYGTKYSRVNQVKFVCLSSPYPIKSFKGCLPQILLVRILNTFSHIEPCQMSMMELISVKCLRLLTINYLRKKAPS